MLLRRVGEDISHIIPILYTYKDQIKHHVLLILKVDFDDAPNVSNAFRYVVAAVYHESQVNAIKFQNLVRNFFYIN